MKRINKMDNMKSKILKKYLTDDTKKWEMAEEIFYYTNRKDLLSETQLQMIKEFLNQDEDNKSLVKDISDNFKDLLTIQIEKISIDIIDHIKSKYTDKIKSAKFAGLAMHNHYINFDLNNDVRIQFKYSNYPYFNFQSIWVRFCKTNFEKNDMKIIIKKIDLENIDSFIDNSIHINKNHKFIDENNFYNIVFDKSERKRVAESHSVIYDLLSKLITTYSIDLQNELE